MLELSLHFWGPALISHFGFPMLSRATAVFLQLKSLISLTKTNPQVLFLWSWAIWQRAGYHSIHRRHYYQEYKQVIITHAQPGFWWVSPGSVSVHCLFLLVVWRIEVVIWLQNLQMIGVGAVSSPLDHRIVTQVDLGSWYGCSVQGEIQYWIGYQG